MNGTKLMMNLVCALLLLSVRAGKAQEVTSPLKQAENAQAGTGQQIQAAPQVQPEPVQTPESETTKCIETRHPEYVGGIPRYTEEAALAHINGSVILEMGVDKDGNFGGVRKVIRNPGYGLLGAVIEAFRATPKHPKPFKPAECKREDGTWVKMQSILRWEIAFHYVEH